MFQSSKWSGEEGEEVFYREGREKRSSIQKGISGDWKKRVFDRGGIELFLNGKRQIFWPFCFSYFFKKISDK